MNKIIDTIKSRRSVRKFKEDKIKEEELLAILDAAIHAPSGHNDQPWHFTVIENKEMLERINMEAKEEMIKSEEEWICKIGKSSRNILHDAPTLIIVSGRSDTYSPLIDASAATENLMIAATSLNIGTCWVGLVNYFFKNLENIELLGIKEGYQPFYAIAVGYIKEGYEAPKINRNKDVVNYIK